MMEIAVIGKDDFIIGFRLSGVRRIYGAKDEKELEDRVKLCLSDQNIGIVVLHADDIKKLSAALQKTIDESVEPTFIAIGGREESGLRDKIKRAIGVDLWK